MCCYEFSGCWLFWGVGLTQESSKGNKFYLSRHLEVASLCIAQREFLFSRRMRYWGIWAPGTAQLWQHVLLALSQPKAGEDLWLPGSVRIPGSKFCVAAAENLFWDVCEFQGLAPLKVKFGTLKGKNRKALWRGGEADLEVPWSPSIICLPLSP